VFRPVFFILHTLTLKEIPSPSLSVRLSSLRSLVSPLKAGHLPSLPLLRSRPPLRISFPSGTAAKRILVHFGPKFAPVWLLSDE